MAEHPDRRAGGGARHRSYWPLVPLSVVAVILPVTLRRTPPESLGIGVAMMALLAVASLAAWLAGPRLDDRGRRLVAWCLVALGTLALLVVAHLAVPERPEHALPFAAGVAVTVAPVRRTVLRLPVQVLVVAGMSLLLMAAGRSWGEITLTVLLLTFVVWLSGVLAGSLLEARRSQQRAREAAERRAALLRAVQELSGSTAAQAARTVVDSLRSLGFPVAGVSLVRDDRLVPLALDGVPPSPGLRVDQGIAGAAIAEDRTMLSERDDLGLPVQEELGSVIAVPVRSAGRAVGVVIGGRGTAGPWPDDMVEIAEVLASHLGGVLETEERLGRQHELLERMRALEDMRVGLATHVSEDVRDPLTVVRGIAETLRLHGDRLAAERRAQLLQGFEDQASALRETIDTLLDFSRLRASRPVPVVGLLDVGELLGSVFGSDMVGGDLDTIVRTDAILLGRILEILRGLGHVRRVHVTADEGLAVVRLESDAPQPWPRARLLLELAERLIVSVGGTWNLERDAVVVGLPRDVTRDPEAAP